jgi:hypothetical protein
MKLADIRVVAAPSGQGNSRRAGLHAAAIVNGQRRGL